MQKRFLLFMIGCIGARLLIVYIAKYIDIQLLKYMGYIALIPACGFIVIYLTGIRQTGNEVFGDKIWWNELRPIHAMLYGMFAYNAINGNKCAWIFLFIDLFVGIISFLAWHGLINTHIL